MRFCIDAWDVSYGTALAVAEEDLPASVARVETDVETPADQWAPIPGDSNVPHPSAVLFVDAGVRRIDARVWIDDSPAPGAGTANAPLVTGMAATASMAVCASYAMPRLSSAAADSPGGGRLTLLPPRSAGACSPPPRMPLTSRPGVAPTGPGTPSAVTPCRSR